MDVIGVHVGTDGPHPPCVTFLTAAAHIPALDTELIIGGRRQRASLMLENVFGRSTGKPVPEPQALRVQVLFKFFICHTLVVQASCAALCIMHYVQLKRGKL